MNRAFIFIGTNIDRSRNYIEGLRRVAALGHLRRVSSVFETRPVGGRGGDFYNGAALLETAYDARRLKDALERIEDEMGRVRSDDRNAPRTIDLDLVLYNQEQIDDGRVRVPDPLIATRNFLAHALAEISPGYVHPENGRTLAEIASGLESGGETMRVEPAMTARVKRFWNEIQTGETTHA